MVCFDKSLLITPVIWLDVVHKLMFILKNSLKNFTNTVRTKIKDTNKLQNKITKITGYKNILHASKVTKEKGKKLKINLQITAKRCRIQRDSN